MKARWTATALITVLFIAASFLVVWASDAQMYFAADKNGENRITQVQEGDEIWIVVIDPDEDNDCDVRDKVWTDVKVMDTKTGAHIVWKSYLDEGGVDTTVPANGSGNSIFGDADYMPYKGHWPGASAGWLGEDYLEETGSSTGVFVSSRPFMIGTRVAFDEDGRHQAHIVGPYTTDPSGWVEPTDFEWGGYLYADGDDDEHGDDRIWVTRAQTFQLTVDPPDEITGTEFPDGNAYLPPGDGTYNGEDYILGRFENMDTLIGLYVDQNDRSDTALTMLKITDTEAVLEWNREVYRDANEAALIRVIDPDENLNCSVSEMVPVFVIVNPGSWNPLKPTSANDFCMLKRYGGVEDVAGNVPDSGKGKPIVWYSIYDSRFYIGLGSNQPNVDGTYYIEYPTQFEGTVTWFDTASDTGITRVMFYAQETSADSGIFELRLNDILTDLGFNSLNVRDTLVAYYVDPNDQDDVKVATAYIEEKNHSSIRFTDFGRTDESVFWIGRDPVYIEVTDANANVDSCCPEQIVVQVCDPHEVDDTEYLILDELSSNSPIFFTHTGMRLISVWDALGVGSPGALGGYSLELDNWALEAFNEDSIYVRYNDVVYTNASMQLLGDSDTTDLFPPVIETARVANDVSFAVFEVGDTQVFDGETTNMYFLDRQGNRVSGYLNSDCAFIEVVDLDQDEDQYRRERIDAFWDGNGNAGQNTPFGPMHFDDNHPVSECEFKDEVSHIVNDILGDTNIFDPGTWAKLYILNPRNGRWAPVDLLETGSDSGTFVSVSCVDLINKFDCAPSLGVLPGDTLLAVYNDPSNHSDVAWISIKVGIGGGAMALGSQTTFVDAAGNSVAAYIEGELAYVKVFDTSIAGAGSLQEAVTIDGVAYDLVPVVGESAGAFMTAALDLNLTAGQSITATYIDPSDPKDTSSDTITVVASELIVDRFYAGPSPFSDVVTFAYVGSGLAETFTAAVYDLSGNVVWTIEEHNVLDIVWDGRNEDGRLMANGAYIYVVFASNGESVYTDKGQLFILR